MKSFNVHRPQLTGLTIRYLKQRDPYCCGPVALLNYWKWYGHRVTFKGHFKLAAERCRYIKPNGTYRNCLSKAVSKRQRKATWLQVKRALLADKSIIVSTAYPEGGHIWFISNLLVDCKHVVAINYNYRHTYSVLPYQAVVALLRNSVVWFLTK